MAYNAELAEKVRRTLANVGTIDEKQMFGALGFMVNGKAALVFNQSAK